jgi:hypothetical protein
LCGKSKAGLSKRFIVRRFSKRLLVGLKNASISLGDQKIDHFYFQSQNRASDFVDCISRPLMSRCRWRQRFLWILRGSLRVPPLRDRVNLPPRIASASGRVAGQSRKAVAQTVEPVLPRRYKLERIRLLVSRRLFSGWPQSRPSVRVRRCAGEEFRG